MRPLFFLTFIVFAANALGANWPAWRGPLGTGVCLETNLPVHWGTKENVLWRITLPERGNSTPVIWGNRVFVTQAVGGKSAHRRTLICFERSTGQQLWQSGTDAIELEPTHETNPYCSASPVTDGETVIVSFGAAGLYAYDFEGHEKWHRDLGPQKHIWGNAASPVIYQDLCILNFGPGERTFLVAVDKKIGKTVWQLDQPGGDSGQKKPGQDKDVWIGSWTTPVIAHIDDHDELLMSFPSRLVSLEPRTGKEQWSCRGLNPLVYTSPLYSDGVVVAMGGFGGSSLAVKTGGHGDVTETHRLWQIPKTRQRIGSGVISGEYIYIVDDPGIAECIDLKTGKPVWEQRLSGQGAKSDNWSSLVLSGDKLYAINQSGDGFVLRASPKFEVISTNSIGEPTIASTAPSDGDLFIRTHKALWCIREKK